MQTAAENRTGKWNTVRSIYRIWSNDGILVTVLHTAGLEKKSFMTFSYSPLPPTHCHYAITNNTTTNVFQMFLPAQTEGKGWGKPSPLLDSFSSISITGHSQGVCANLLHMVAKMISWLTHKESLTLSGVLYIICRGGKGVVVRKYNPVKQNVKKF